MNGSLAANRALVDGIRQRLPAAPGCDVVLCPPAVYLSQVAELLRGQDGVVLGAQDVSAQPSGAYTGDVATSMLEELGVRYCIVGHSERRLHQQESDWLVAQKALRLLDAGMTPVVCVGESLQQREQGWTGWVVGHQLDALLRALGARMADVVLAYEPIWAIGTGHTAEPAQAQQVHAALRGQLAQAGVDAQQVRIIYGGSMKAGNAAALLAQPDVDGGLVGGAALVATEFSSIVEAASRGVKPGADVTEVVE